MKRILTWLVVAGVAIYLTAGLWSDLLGRAGGLAGSTPRLPLPQVSLPGSSEQPPAQPGEGGALVLINPSLVQGSTPPTVTGHAFEPGEEVVVTIRGPFGKQERVGSGWADKDGNFSGVNITLSQGSPPGRYVVRASGQTSRRWAEANLEVRATGPYAEPDSYSGKPGQQLAFKGGGFRPGEEVGVYFDSVAADPIGRLQADREGNLPREGVAVPMTAPGDHTFYLMGQESRAPLRFPFSVLGFYPWVGLEPYSPQPYQSITFEGHDFAPGEDVLIYLNGVTSPPVAVGRADADGYFRLEQVFALPIEKPGENVFIFVGTQSQSRVEATFEVLPFSPVLELTQYAGPPGSTVAFNGTGFAHNEEIHVYLGSGQQGQEIGAFEAGPEGTFAGAGAFTVPYGTPTGQTTITAVGDRSGMSLAITFGVLPFTPSGGMTAYFGPPGMEIGFNGQGFAPGDNVSIFVGEAKGTPVLTVVADDTGSFELAGPYTIPESAKESVAFVMLGDKSRMEVGLKFEVGAAENGAPETKPPVDEAPSGGGVTGNTPPPGGE